jgi:K+-sensing histidine kinase KdpD
MKVLPEQAERLHRFAHDVRNRLIGLQQVLEQLGHGEKDAERLEFIRFGEKQYFKALREVEILLDDLGVDRGAITPNVERFPVAVLANEHVELLKHRFSGKLQRVELDIPVELHVMADRRVTGDILNALFSNASKFSSAESTIRIGATVNGEMVELAVHDHGTGLSAEDLAQVFDRFAWLSNEPTGTESQGRGTLSRVRGHAQAQHGDLLASSAGVDRGCTFTLRLPLG